MKRKITEKLLNWKNDNNRKPLIINGARQTGKTYSILDFGEKFYKNTIHVNFEKDNDVINYFKNSLEPKLLINLLENKYKQEIVPSETLIFFDEVQECSRDITFLKYFNELANEYHIICCGSYFGVSLLRDKTSFPVGKVNTLDMFPMDFEEFLWATNNERITKDIEYCYNNNEKMIDPLHDMALNLYRQYLVTGGMPEVVKVYITTNSFLKTTERLEEIFNNYLNDMGKYATASQTLKNIACYKSIAGQLLKNNKNFKYSFVMDKKDGRYFDYAINWLVYSKIALKSTLVDIPKIPLSSHENQFLFRIYLSDPGLLRFSAGIEVNNLLDNDYRDDLTDIIAENYVACSFACNNIPLRYWVGKRDSEIEFMVELDKQVVPIVVKAGKRVSSESLNVYKQNYKVSLVYRISSKNFGMENGIKSVPLYAVFCLAKELRHFKN